MEKMKSKILLFGFVVALLFGAIASVYFLGGKTATYHSISILPTRYPSLIDSLSPTSYPIPNPENKFNLDEVKVGDKIVGMTVKSIEPFEKSRNFSKHNISIKFTGEATITGKYFYLGGPDSLFPENIAVCFELDATSSKLMPQKDGYKIWFCFNNDDFARTMFNPAGSSGRATITIDNYTMNIFPSEVWDTADLVRIISKE